MGFLLVIVPSKHEKDRLKMEADATKYGYGIYVPDEDSRPQFKWIIPPDKKGPTHEIGR